MKKKKASNNEKKIFTRWDMQTFGNFCKDVELDRIIDLIGICKVCKGTHGQWVRKEDLIKLIKDGTEVKTHE